MECSLAVLVVTLLPASAIGQQIHLTEDRLNAAGANGLASLVLQCLWESFALPVIVNPLVMSQQADAPRQQTRGQPLLRTVLTQCNVLALPCLH